MRLTTAVSVLLACSKPFVSSLPTSPESTVDASATPANISGLIERVRTIVDTDDLNFGQLVKMGTQLLNDFAIQDDDAALATRSPMHEHAHVIRARINSGDVDLNKAAKDGLAKLNKVSRDVDFNALASEGLTLLESKMNEQDFNDIIMKRLSQGIASGNQGLRSRVKRGLIMSAISGLFSNISFKSVAKMGMKIMTMLVKNIDFNALASKGMSLMSSAIGNTNLNTLATRGTDTLDGLVDKVDLNSLAAKGLNLLLG